jgi:cob(I)alamin adenosyltransferase
VSALEVDIDRYNEALSPLSSFVLPGGTAAAAHLHVARTVVRRAERSTWVALDEHRETMNPVAATYLNRLSDLLFVLARYVNRDVGDVLWVPGGSR